MNRKPNRAAAFVATLLIVVLAGACAGPPATHYYELRLPADASARSDRGGGGITVGVKPFRIDPPFDQDRIVYRIGADSPEIGFYAYHRWAAPLGRMLPKLVAESLRGSEGLLSIEPSAPGRRYDALLEGRVLHLEELDVPGKQKVRVACNLVLRRPSGEELWSAALTGAGQLETTDVRVVVEEMGRVLHEALAAQRPDLESALGEGR